MVIRIKVYIDPNSVVFKLGKGRFEGSKGSRYWRFSLSNQSCTITVIGTESFKKKRYSEKMIIGDINGLHYNIYRGLIKNDDHILVQELDVEVLDEILQRMKYYGSKCIKESND